MLDGFLTTPITSETASQLLNILDARDEHDSSTAVTSQFDPEDWYQALHDARSDSIVNRIFSNAEIVQLDGPNMRRQTAATDTKT